MAAGDDRGAVAVFPGGIVSGFNPCVLAIIVFISTMALASAGSFYSALQKRRDTGNRSLFRRVLGASQPLVERYRLTGSQCVGVLFGAMKMPCAGGLYLVVLGQTISSGNSAGGMASLLLFDAGLVLPIAAPGLLLAAGVSHEKLNTIRRRYRSGLHVLTGLVLLLMAIGIVFNLV